MCAGNKQCVACSQNMSKISGCGCSGMSKYAGEELTNPYFSKVDGGATTPTTDAKTEEKKTPTKTTAEKVGAWASVGTEISKTLGNIAGIFGAKTSSSTTSSGNGASSTDEPDTNSGIPSYVWYILGGVVLLLLIYLATKYLGK